MAQPQDALHFREIMGRMLLRDTEESTNQAFMVAPIRQAYDRQQNREIMRRVRIHMAELINTGDIFYVSPEITGYMVRLMDDLITHNRPFHFQPEDFPTLTGMVYFDGLIEIPTAYPDKWGLPPETLDRLRVLTWGQLRVEGEGVVGKVLYSFVDNRRHPEMAPTSSWVARHWMPMHYGQPFEPRGTFRRESLNEFEADEIPEEEVDRLLERQQRAAERIAALLYVWTQFLKTEIVASPRYQADRQHLKVMEREGRPLPPFRTVVLRRYAPSQEKSELGGGIEYSHRWKVRQHWRNQRVGPGRQMIRPTLVTEHIKGPAWAPLDDRDTVQAVVR